MVTRALKLVYSEIRGLHQAAYILALFAFGSQILALVRDRLFAHTFGAGSELDLYYAAFRIPDILYVLFVSVLSVYVLLPFVAKARLESDDAGKRVLGQMFTLFLFGYIAIAGVVFILAPYLVPIFFPGLVDNAETLVLLLRILLLQPLLLGISTLFGVVTQLSHRFVLYAISPLIYNLGIIAGVIIFYPHFGLAGLVMGVVLGALGHMLVQWPLVIKSELSFGLVKKFDFPLLKSVFLVALPRALTLSLHQLVLLVLVGAATLMAAGSVAIFQFALNLQSVPLAIIGMSYSVAAFPVLADLFAKKEQEAFNSHVLTAFRHIIFWSLPIIALVVVLRAQIVRVVLGSGAFDWADTRLTAAVLAIFIITLAAQSILLLLVRAFYAGGKTIMPLIVALIGSGTTLLTAWLSFHVIKMYPDLMSGLETLLRVDDLPGTKILLLALAFAVGVLLEMIILIVLAMQEFSFTFKGIFGQLFQSSLAAAVGGIAAYGTLIFIVDGVNQETFVGILIQGAIAGVVGLSCTLLTYYLCGSEELSEIYRSLHSRIFKKKLVGMSQDVL
ncbi:MAG TPA: lipid II flippase MurJ [Candidatus Paceibacterota bacterium]|nr:lipid II flippase MurJ [Candidatus Paceibacterota bacterium]HMO83121.1 lipid II flippase MurJ [Candidatus Paceibacterota bacterium]